ncbi:MAG: radical SAM protein, partial [Chloroflexota bacterium]|nr:radical SAM protein [Chloroflexota bacterium]
IVAEIKSRVEEGCNEVVLTGTRVGAYDCMSGLDGLIERILDETTVARIRLSSLRPQELEPSLIRLWRSNERVCRHLHMSLQSGSDATLRRMGRDYSTDEYETALNMIREAMPDIAVTTDVIVGFPGETDDEFEQSYSFCQRIGFADLHIFAYSIRPGTPSAQMTGKVPDKIKKDRSLAMLNMAWHSARDYRRGFTGKTVPVLWEEQKGNNIWIGRTDNYIKIMTRSVVSLCNRLINARLGDECEDALWGELEEDGHIPAQNEERPTGQRSVS